NGAENRVCLNDGSGSFTCSNVSGDTNDSFGVAVADVDGGTGLDLIFANNGAENRVCLNDGSGSFTCSDGVHDTLHHKPQQYSLESNNLCDSPQPNPSLP
ncbi:MAG: hypothetical protein IH820_11850, partial [Bacteroidetes bacterium]|nr:hypothetical protein [Bacteroidota bacterium]